MDPLNHSVLFNVLFNGISAFSMWISFETPREVVGAPDVTAAAIYRPASRVVQVYGFMTGMRAY